MQKQWINCITILTTVLLALLLLPAVKGGVNAAPQGRELYAKVEEGEITEEIKPPTKQANEEKKHLVKKKEIIKVTITKTKEEQEEAHNGDIQDKTLEVEITEPSETTRKCSEIESNCDPLVLASPQGKNHKLRARQTADDTGTSPIEDLVGTLLRQRDDFIAASGMAESPRPVEVVRANMNSGL
uniref:Uncharacterized protein n=1 Tax=Stomoxys calcitrans TaxID=35570 RepID=A0A1I8NLF9_STOCA